MEKPKLIVAGPGAGKTHNMVEAILQKLPELTAPRYMAVITYTNSATENIRKRLGAKINIPPNLFIGTFHSFLNRFIVIPYSSIHDTSVGKEKLFIQCQIDDILNEYKKDKPKMSPEQSAYIKKSIKDSMNTRGFISFDQTVALAKSSLENKTILDIVSNRIQYLFIDEFQDTGSGIFAIVESFRKAKKTKIYCVGDPEQFIQSFDSSVRNFNNIAIMKIIAGTTYDVQVNTANHRCSETIVTFLNNFSSRAIKGTPFFQKSETGLTGSAIRFLSSHGEAKPIIEQFNVFCDEDNISIKDRCVIAKKNDVVKRIVAAVDNKFTPPTRIANATPIKSIIDNLLTAVGMNQSQFCTTHKVDVHTLRKYAVAIFTAIRGRTIHDVNSYVKFLVEELKLTVKTEVPIKIENIRAHFNFDNQSEVVTVSNIHLIKGLEAEAVLAIAKTQKELLLWIETDQGARDKSRKGDDNDYPRLGYVAFSRAKKLLCIACLEPVSTETKARLTALNVVLV